MMDNQDKTYPLLDAIDSPADLRRLAQDQLPEVCAEVRQEIIDVCSRHPGHLASSLGAVEIAVALHYTLDTPEDRIVWDVGHQAYAHKILTGRRRQFHTLREWGGIKPFPSPDESPYDVNTCGHASNSISIALGLAVAAQQSASKRKVVAVIGDGAMSGGLAFEGLNNVSSTPNNLLIILNDNNMSISPAVGGMKHYLHHLHTSNTYNTFRWRAAQKLASWGLLSESRKKDIIRFNNALKAVLTHQRNIFEGLAIRDFGPIDGNNIDELVRTLNEIKDMEGPRILHVHTVKGKGYRAAEHNATVWHAPGKFDPKTGERKCGGDEDCPPKFQQVFGKTLVELAERNDRIVGVTPAMPVGCSMDYLFKVMPRRAFDVGIAEGHAVTFSAGMAIDGCIPYCNIYSSFAQRAYDNIIHDVAISRLHVVLCLDRGGLVGADGPTHHGAFDIAALRAVPHLTIASPLDGKELRRMMYTAQMDGMGPFVIRYPRGRVNDKDWHCELESVPVGRARCLKEGHDVALISFGPIGIQAAEAIRQVEADKRAQGLDYTIAHYDLRFVKPLDEETLLDIGRRFSRIVTIEDGVRQGGMGSAVTEFMEDHGYTPHMTRLGLPDEFVPHGAVDQLYAEVGLDVESIKHAIS